MREQLGSLLHHCSKIKAQKQGLALHAATLKAGLLSDIIISNHVLNLYAKCGAISNAHKLFDEMPERNLVSWAALISGYDQAGEPRMAVDLHSRLRLTPNEFVFASVISACASLTYLTYGQQVHAQALKLGYGFVSYVSNALITLYMKCGLCDDAFAVFSSPALPNSVTYNALIAGFVDNWRPESALEMFRLMHRRGLVLDRFSFAGLLEVCAKTENLQMGLQLHCQTMKLNLDSIAFVGNVIVSMYSKFKLINEAEEVFRLIVGKDVVSWNTLMSAYIQSGEFVKGLNLFPLMRETVVWPDDFTFASALTSCGAIASVSHGKQIHAHLVRRRLNRDIVVENALMNMYAKCGCIQHAYSIFKQIKHPNNVSWNSIIGAFGYHGSGTKALVLFQQMRESGLKPDSVTFLSLLVACNHSGLVEEGESFFEVMQEVYNVTPNVEHFSCLIDLLGRAGRLSDAENYMKKFHFEEDVVVLGSLLSACRLHGDVFFGERMGEHLLKLKPLSTSPFVLLSNLYAFDSTWSSVAKTRKMLKDSGLIKEPGYSVIEVQGKLEQFIVGDSSHSSIDEIKHVLRLFYFETKELLTQLLGKHDMDPF